MHVFHPRQDGGQTPSATTTALVVVSVVFILLSAAAIALRFYVRWGNPRVTGADDLWLIVAWIGSFAMSLDVWVCASLAGNDYYKVDVQYGTLISSTMIWSGALIVQMPLTAVKISILLFYKRIFTMRYFRIYIWTAITLVSIWGVLFFFLVLLEADPVSSAIHGGPKFRYNVPSLGLAQVGTSIGLDVLVLVFPLPVISRLKMTLRRKVEVSLIFWLGSFCVITAIVRLVYLNRSIRTIVDHNNLVFLQDKIFIWKIIEPNASIIAACLPTYGPLIRGGRAPESIIRSVRSILSIGSHISRRSRGSKDSGLPQKNPDSGHDSQVNLNTQRPSGSGHGVPGSIERGEGIELATIRQPDRIEVTHEVDVRRN